MGLELYNKKDSDLIPMCELKGGQIAIIEDARNSEYNGSIVTRAIGLDGRSALFIAIGEQHKHNEYSSEWFASNCSLLVRVLPPGMLLKIT